MLDYQQNRDGNVKIDGEECTFLRPRGSHSCTPEVDVIVPPRRASLAPRGKHSGPTEVGILVVQRLTLFTVKINIVCPSQVFLQHRWVIT